MDKLKVKDKNKINDVMKMNNNYVAGKQLTWQGKTSSMVKWI